MADRPPVFILQHWERYDVPTMWSWLSRENDYSSREQERAWQRTHDLLDGHRATLEGVFNALLEVWPDRPGTASETFAAELRQLISSVAETSQAARGNAIALSRLSDSLMSARSRMEDLNRQWTQTSSRSPNVPEMVGLKDQAITVMAEADAATHDYAAQLSGAVCLCTPRAGRRDRWHRFRGRRQTEMPVAAGAVQSGLDSQHNDGRCIASGTATGARSVRPAVAVPDGPGSCS